MNGWLAGLSGGILIGVSATLLLWANGRIAGISGIVEGLTAAPRGDRAWRWAFLAGLAGAGALTLHAMKGVVPWPAPALTPSLLVAGVLVGFGTSLGSGCTSGHGVCGLGRLSKRSLVAVITFIATAMATVYITRHVLGGAG